MTATRQKKAQILIVDDHPIVRHGFAEILSAQPDLYVCGEASSPAEAWAVIESTEVSLAIVDISLKGGNGLELVKEICDRRDLAIKILICSMHDELLYAERALLAGASGYLNKGEAAEKIVDAIYKVLDGGTYLSEQLKDRLVRGTAGPRRSGTSPLDNLTDRELQVFELLGRALTTRQIADELGRSPKTIEAHRENIKAKLKLKNSTELVQHAVKWILDQH